MIKDKKILKIVNDTIKNYNRVFVITENETYFKLLLKYYFKALG